MEIPLEINGKYLLYSSHFRYTMSCLTLGFGYLCKIFLCKYDLLGFLLSPLLRYNFKSSLTSWKGALQDLIGHIMHILSVYSFLDSIFI